MHFAGNPSTLSLFVRNFFFYQAQTLVGLCIWKSIIKSNKQMDTLPNAQYCLNYFLRVESILLFFTVLCVSNKKIKFNIILYDVAACYGDCAIMIVFCLA